MVTHPKIVSDFDKTMTYNMTLGFVVACDIFRYSTKSSRLSSPVSGFRTASLYKTSNYFPCLGEN